MRDAVGDRIAILTKLNLSDGVRGGITVEEAVQTAQWIEQDGTVDALEMTAGSSLLNPMYLFKGGAPVEEFVAVMPQPMKTVMRLAGRGFIREYPYRDAYLLDDARRVRAEVSLPMILLGGITDRASMDLAMGEGFEFVAMGRALLREPDLVNRIAADPATPSLCIHCNRCMPTNFVGTHCPVVHDGSSRSATWGTPPDGPRRECPSGSVGSRSMDYEFDRGIALQVTATGGVLRPPRRRLGRGWRRQRRLRARRRRQRGPRRARRARAGRPALRHRLLPHPLAPRARRWSACGGCGSAVDVRRSRRASCRSEDGAEVERLSILGVYGDLGEPARSSGSSSPPELPPVEDCVETRFAPEDVRRIAPLLERFGTRLDPAYAGWAVGRPSGSGIIQGWFRLVDDRPLDPIALLMVVDALPPVTFDLGRPGWAPTLELTAHVRARPAPGPAIVRHATRTISGGQFEEDCEVWDSTGRLVAQSRQLALLPR